MSIRFILVVTLLLITNFIVWSWALEKHPEFQPVSMEFVSKDNMNRLFISLIFISSIFSQQTTVAVLEFDAEGIDNVSSSALASIVRKEVIKAADYKLVDRNSMNEI